MTTELPKQPGALSAREAADLQAAGMKTPFERRLIIASRMAEGYQLTEDGRKHLQHVFTVWFPRAIYRDLADDTVRVDVVVRQGTISGRRVFSTSFVRMDGSVTKKADYDEDRLTGVKCESYDQLRSGYCGCKDGTDFRLVIYTPEQPVSRRL
jgi:hypothetical protein